MNVIFAPSVPWLPARTDFISGAAPNPYQFFELLEQHGITARILDPNRKPWNPLFGRDTLLQSIDPVRALRIAIKERDADVVVSVFEGAATSLGYLRGLFNFRAKLVMWDIGLTNWRLRNKIIDLTLPRIDELYVLGENQVEYIKSHHAHCKRITPIGHYIDADFFRKSRVNQTGYLLSVGEDVGRDFSTLMMATRDIGSRLVIKANRHPLKERHSNVDVIRGRLSYLELKQLYEDCFLVIVPTHVTANASGVSTILEAASVGRPMIVSDNPGIRDFCIPDETCLMVPPHDPEALKDAIKRLLSEPETCKRLADGARNLVEQKFTHSAFAQRFADALKQN